MEASLRLLGTLVLVLSSGHGPEVVGFEGRSTILDVYGVLFSQDFAKQTHMRMQKKMFGLWFPEVPTRANANESAWAGEQFWRVSV